MNNADDIPSKCRICDCWCEGIEQCNVDSCYSTNILFIIAFFIWGMLASVRLFQFYYHSPYPLWTLKKLLYVCGVAVCVLRVLRYILLFAEIEFRGIGALLFDLYLYFFALLGIFFMYSLVLIFWGHVCQKNKTPRGWIGHKMKMILLIANAIVCVIVCIMPPVRVFISSLWVLCNGLISLVAFVLIVLFLKEGSKMLKLIKSLQNTPMEANQLLKSTTLLAVGGSLGLLITFIILLLATIIRSTIVLDSHVACQLSHVFYRTSELGLMTLLVFPLRTFEKSEVHTTHNSSLALNSQGSVNSEL
mmetsp:Transcript_3361/g.4616  ORF Transcript_3361/g.4616 Transcript_3361/m.4616 type:complete len:304 (+) Transcript_3361:3-914(+)